MAAEMANSSGSSNGRQSNALHREEPSNLAAKLFSSLTTANGAKSGNMIISPLLVEAALALLYLGSDGSTAEQLQAILQLKNRYANNAKMANYYAAELAVATRTNSVNDCNAASNASANASASSSTHIAMCSRIYVPENYEISEEFRKIAQKYFHIRTSMGAAQQQQQLENDSELTQICGKDYVRHLLQSVTSAHGNGSGVLLVAANFQNKWFLPFSAYRTGLYEFHMNSGATEDEQQPPKQVAMLHDDDMFVKYAEFRDLDARGIELPYECEDEDEELSMLLILPNKRDGLSALLEQLCNTDLTLLAEQMQMESVQILLPKFRINFECSLRQSLEQFGVSAIFSKDANFKNLLHEKSPCNLQFENIIHRVSIDVNESGSIGSNVTGALKPIVASNSRQKCFRADHPFVFAVRNRDAIYFIGHVTTF